MKVPSQQEMDLAMRDLVDTTTYLDEETGLPYEPIELPEVVDPVGDDDSA